MTRNWLTRLSIIGCGVMLAGATGQCFGGGQPTATAGSQGWTTRQQTDWYGGKQGSRLMPYSWFRALERADAAQPFNTPEHMAAFRFLQQATRPLPVGFAVDDNADDRMTYSRLRWYRGQGNKEQWVGLNCAACHTAEIEYQGKPPLRIDGGPGLVDFQAFTAALDRALVATRDDSAKFDRFARAVLRGDDPADRAMLKAELGRLIDWQQQVAALDATPLAYGFGRLDAVGRIYNKVALFTRAGDRFVNPPDAPVSYPFLWDIWRQDRLQWNGIARSARLKLGGDRFLDYGAMGRNTGEVIGVFGDIDTRPGTGLRGYHSSVWADNLDRLEIQLRALKAPRWPAGYFAASAPADAAQVAEGRRLFEKGCQSCHGLFGPEVNRYAVTMVPLNGPERNRTDPWMACNAFTYDARTGNLTGVKDGYVSGRPLAAVEPSGTVLATMVKGTLLGKRGQILKQTANTIVGVNRRPVVVEPEGVATPEDRIAERLRRCVTEENELLAYKSRPLDGIWATAPYLHNGSVPTLYDLLLPPERRPRTFHVGTRQYDPVKVGYVTAAASPGNSFLFDTRLRGNSNAGHDYGAARMTDAQRWALVAYMKTL